ncbi:MAG: SMC-Scp complex subunit ScpB [Eubacteriales bacterium]|jgi:segregation and condensation protein B
MTVKQAENVIESILFTAGEPLAIERLASVLDMRKSDVVALLRRMADSWEAQGRGVRLLLLEDTCQMCADPANEDYISLALRKKKKPVLSRAAMEVLAIVAYQQPVTRAYVEQVRGIDSSNVMSNLLEKGYIRECGRLDAPGRPMLFGTSEEFLRVFGLSSLSELPKVEGAGQLETMSAETETSPASQ